MMSLFIPVIMKNDSYQVLLIYKDIRKLRRSFSPIKHGSDC